MRPIKKPEQDTRADFLRKKWGFNNPEINNALERTHQDLITNFLELQDRYKKEVKNCDCNACKENPRISQYQHFQNKYDWEKAWRKRKDEENYQEEGFTPYRQ